MRDVTQLSDRQLLSATGALAARERRITLDILVHLAEIDRRRLYAPQGYSSLFDYCRRCLRYSESAANRRIRTARCLRRVPELRTLLESGAVSVATVSMVASLLTTDNKDELLSAIAGKSQSEVEAIVSTFRVGKPVRDRIKPLTVAKPRVSRPLLTRAATQSNVGSPSGAATCSARANRMVATNATLSSSRERPDPHRPGGGKKLTAGPPETKRCFKFEFGADERFMKKFSEVKSLMSSKFPASADLATLFETLMDEYIERHSPRRRAERREKRARHASGAKPPRAKTRTAGEKAMATESSAAKTQTAERPTVRTRHIPTTSRDEVYRRDGGRCTFVGPDGVRCNSTHDVEIDHRRPFVRGGGHEPENLRLLCSAHNRAEAARVMGSFNRRE